MKRTLIIAAAALAAASFTAKAQTAGFLDVNPDPLSLGMAGTGTVMEATPFAMWNNIASTTLDEQKFQIGAAYSLWQPSMTANNTFAVAGYGRVARFMTISAGVKYFGSKPFDITDGSTGLVTGQFTPVDLEAGIGLGFRILPILSLGANVSYVHSDIGGPEKGGAVSADFGALLDLKFMRVGLTAENIGSKISYGYGSYNLPANVNLGVGTIQRFGESDKHALAVNLQAGMTLYEPSVFAGLGAQYTYNDFFRVSAGYHYGDAEKQFFGSYASVGAGIKVLGLMINAAYLIGTDKDSPLTNTFTIGLGYAF